MTNDETNATSDEQAPLSVFLTEGVSAVGQATIQMLTNAGHKATAVVSTTQEANEVRALGGFPVSVDLLRSGEIKGMLKMAESNVVVNMAAQAYNTLPFNAPPADLTGLTDGTQALVDAAKAAGVEYIIHPSFAYLYGDTGAETINEDHALSSDSTALLAAGRQAEAIIKDSGIPYSILRAGYLYGSGSQSINTLIATLRSGKIPPTGDRDDNYANWVYSSDLAAAIKATAEQRPVDEIINITGTNPVTPETFLEDLSDELGISLDRSFGFLARMLSMPSRPSPLLKFSTKASIDKAKDVLGWEPRYATHIEGIEAMLIDMRAQMSN